MDPWALAWHWHAYQRPSSLDQVSGQKLDLHQGLALPEPPMQDFLFRMTRKVYSAQLFSRTINIRCFGDVKSLLLAQHNVCVKTVSATTLDGSNNTAAEAEDEWGMSESPMFEIPVTHFGFDRNAKAIQRATKQLGFQGCELWSQFKLCLIKGYKKKNCVNLKGYIYIKKSASES